MKVFILYKFNGNGNSQREQTIECDDYQFQSKEKVITFIKLIRNGVSGFIKTIPVLIVNFDTIESIEITQYESKEE
jgi:hypothetical protein